MQCPIWFGFMMQGRPPRRRWLPLAAVVALAVITTGCGSETDVEVIERSLVPLRGEQVVLTPDQIKCGEKQHLWTLEQIEGAGAVARLEEEGRALFADDVRMGDRRFPGPVAQVLGDAKVKVKKIISTENESESVKVITAELGVVVDHACFANPLPLLGIERGDFSADVPARIRLRNEGGWSADAVLH